LVVESSKRVHTATHGDLGEAVRVVAFMDASGRNWILSNILYQR
jgi:hypothetical protein